MTHAIPLIITVWKAVSFTRQERLPKYALHFNTIIQVDRCYNHKKKVENLSAESSWGNWAKTALAARFANLALYKRRNCIPRKLHCPCSVQTTTECSDSCKKVDQQDQLRNARKLLSPTIRCFYHTRNKDLHLYLSLCDFLRPPGHVCICPNSLEVGKGLCFAYAVKIHKRWISLFKHEKFEVTPKYLLMH